MTSTDQNETGREPCPIIISDLDGTITDCSHRRHLLRQNPKQWDEFHKACVDDTPNHTVIGLLRRYAPTHQIYIMSGRSTIVEEETHDWLRGAMVPYDRLLLRPEKHFVDDCELKATWVQKLIGDWSRIHFVLEDRDKVVAMWRRNGVPCFQVNYGDF